MPHAVNVLSGTVTFPDGENLVIGYAATGPNEAWRLPVVRDLPRYLELCNEQSCYGETTEVYEQWPDGTWKLPLMNIHVPQRGGA